MEEWKAIEGCNYYLISTEGNFKSVDRIIEGKNGKKQLWKGKEFNKHKNKDGYLVVYIRIKGKRYAKYLHRLVAEAFIPNSENKPCVDHINSNKEDNRICNLRWCTIEENQNNPNTIEKFKNKIVSDITRKKISDFAKTRIGSKNPNWKGGVCLNKK